MTQISLDYRRLEHLQGSVCVMKGRRLSGVLLRAHVSAFPLAAVRPLTQSRAGRMLSCGSILIGLTDNFNETLPSALRRSLGSAAHYADRRSGAHHAQTGS